VDVVSHSYGYFTTRAYLASPGYGSPALPRINDFISMGGANDGVSIAYNWLNDNFVGPGSSLSEGGLYPILNAVYEAVASGAATVYLPGGGTITARSIEDAAGQASPTLFIRQYIPSFADFMAAVPGRAAPWPAREPCKPSRLKSRRRNTSIRTALTGPTCEDIRGGGSGPDVHRHPGYGSRA
jgi:hypothetical protein